MRTPSRPWIDLGNLTPGAVAKLKYSGRKNESIDIWKRRDEDISPAIWRTHEGWIRWMRQANKIS